MRFCLGQLGIDPMARKINRKQQHSLNININSGYSLKPTNNSKMCSTLPFSLGDVVTT